MAKLASVGKYLKYTDLAEDQDTVLTINRIEQVKFDDGKTKWVVFFNETEQGLVLNATNMKTLIKVTGTNETDEMAGKRVALYCKDDIEFGGELVSGIRIRPKAIK